MADTGSSGEAFTTAAIITSLITNGVIASLLFVGVAVMVLLWPDFFTPRLKGGSVTGVHEKPPAIRSGLAVCGGFALQMCCLSSDTVRKQAGYDGYMLTQLVHYSLLLFGLYTLFSLAVLVPVCFTASSDQGDIVIRAGLDNIPDGSPRLWAFTVSAFILTALTCVMLYKLAVEYAQLRRSYLRAAVLRGAPAQGEAAAPDTRPAQGEAAAPDTRPAQGAAAADTRPASAQREAAAVSATQASRDETQAAHTSSASPAKGASGGHSGDSDTSFGDGGGTYVDLTFAAQCAVRGFGDDGSTAWPRTVMALDVPPHVTNSSQLLEMFQALYPGEVHSALLVPGIHGVRRLHQEREWLAQWYGAARWQHDRRGLPSRRVVFARQCRFIACLWRECFHWDPLYTEEGVFLEHAPGEAERDRLHDAEREVHKHNKHRVQAAAVPAHPHRFVKLPPHNTAVGPAQRSDVNDAYAHDSAWEGPDSDMRGAYCCCCLPCSSCKRGRGCHCLVATQACCGSIQPALPRLRNELLRTNALLGGQRRKWWLRALPPVEGAAEDSASDVPSAAQQEVAPAAGAPADAKSAKPQAGGTGFVTFRTARQAVTAANSYHLPPAVSDLPSAAMGGVGGAPPAEAPTAKSPDAAAPSQGGVAGDSSLGHDTAGAWGVLGQRRMTVRQAPHPLDVNYHSCTLNSAETGQFRALVSAILFAMLLLYSALAVLLAAGGGEGGDARGGDADAGFFTELYEGVIQSVLLSLLLALLPTWMHLLGRLSRFRERSEAWVGIVMVSFGESVQAVLERVASQPLDAVTVLGRDLPQFASFYVSFILLKALADLPRQMLQVVQFAYFLVRFRSCPNVRAALCTGSRGGGADSQERPAGVGAATPTTATATAPYAFQGTDESPADSPGAAGGEGGGLFAQPQAQRNKMLEAQAAAFGLSPRSYFDKVVQGGSRFRYEDSVTDILFVMLIGFIFGGMVPVLPPLIALTMAVMGMVYKYQLVYRKTQWVDSGAAFMPAVLRRIAFGAGGHCAVTSALQYERGQALPASITLLPLVFLVLFAVLLDRRVLRGADLLSLKEAVEGDAAHGRMGVEGGQTHQGDENEGVAGGGQNDVELAAAAQQRHAYVPVCVVPARDSQPGVVVLPPVGTPAAGRDRE